MISSIADWALSLVSLYICAGCIYLTIKSRCVQVRLLPSLFRLMSTRQTGRIGPHAIGPRKALFTAMSTTLGISTIVAPVIAIRLGGPGAMLGFLLTSLLGSAATYVEVSLSLQHRQIGAHGISGGPMQYLKQLLSPAAAKWYAVCGVILMMAWSGAQANQVTAILDSPLLGAWRVPTLLSATILTGLILWILVGGIQRIGNFSSKLVPVMFALYLGSCLWILAVNASALQESWLRCAHRCSPPTPWPAAWP